MFRNAFNSRTIRMLSVMTDNECRTIKPALMRRLTLRHGIGRANHRNLTTLRQTVFKLIAIADVCGEVLRSRLATRDECEELSVEISAL
jgi:hypothetical protein